MGCGFGKHIHAYSTTNLPLPITESLVILCQSGLLNGRRSVELHRYVKGDATRLRTVVGFVSERLMEKYEECEAVFVNMERFFNLTNMFDVEFMLIATHGMRRVRLFSQTTGRRRWAPIEPEIVLTI